MGNPNLHNTHIKPEFLGDIKLEQDYLHVSNKIHLKWSLYHGSEYVYDVEERPIFFIRWF